MSRRHTSPQPRRRERGEKHGRRSPRAPLWGGARRWPSAAVIVLAALVLVTVMIAPWVGHGPAPPTPASRTAEPAMPLFDSMPVMAGLPPIAPETRVPVNWIDRFSGEPIVESSPSVMHKGYIVAFCCRNSPGFVGGWDRLTEAEKDTYVRSFLK